MQYEALLALRNRCFPDVSETVKETLFLKPMDTATLPGRALGFDVAHFYRHREYVDGCPGLSVPVWVLERLRLAEKGAAVEELPTRTYVSCHIKEELSDLRLCQELPRRFLTPLVDVALFIGQQADGQKGFLSLWDVNSFFVEEAGEVLKLSVWWQSSRQAPVHQEWVLGCQVADPDFGPMVGSWVIFPGQAVISG